MPTDRKKTDIKSKASGKEKSRATSRSAATGPESLKKKVVSVSGLDKKKPSAKKPPAAKPLKSRSSSKSGTTAAVPSRLREVSAGLRRSAMPKAPAPAVTEILARDPFQQAPASVSFARPQKELPSGYGDHFIYIMARDPYFIYSYWEIRKEQQDDALKQLGGEWGQVQSILRVYAGSDISPASFDIILQGFASAWYIGTEANQSYVVEIGLLHADGRFIALARSNRIITPRMGMSDVLDEEWMGIDFDKMYALSGGFQVGQSSQDLRLLMEKRLTEAVTSGSGGVSSLSSPVKPGEQRGFWFTLDCELIVYGATEPDAKVTMQGKPVQLRSDGTFTLRFALPDGKLVLDAVAESADGVEKRRIVPVVTRSTDRPAPVYKKK